MVHCLYVRKLIIERNPSSLDNNLFLTPTIFIGPLILTWYPLFKLYQRYRSERITQDVQRHSCGLDELCTLNRPSKVAATADIAGPYLTYPGEFVHGYSTADRRRYEDGPPYNMTMSIDQQYPSYVTGSPAPGWRIGLYPKMANKEYV